MTDEQFSSWTDDGSALDTRSYDFGDHTDQRDLLGYYPDYMKFTSPDINS